MSFKVIVFLLASANGSMAILTLFLDGYKSRKITYRKIFACIIAILISTATLLACAFYDNRDDMFWVKILFVQGVVYCSLSQSRPNFLRTGQDVDEK